jgi:lipid-binding SYLF domain-containing protein
MPRVSVSEVILDHSEVRAPVGQGGVDGSIAIVTLGVAGSIVTNKVTSPVIGFILDPEGLMYNSTLEGSKITRISR